MANNNELILGALIEQKVMTPAEVEAYLEAGTMPPVHTYKAWQALGYTVKKGEHAKVKTPLWNFTKKPTKAEKALIEAGELDPKEVKGHYYMAMGSLFTEEQVERLEDTGKVKRPAKKGKKAPAKGKTKTAASSMANALPGAPWHHTEKVNRWSGYDSATAEAHLANWGLIFCDEYGDPIDRIEMLADYLRG